MRSALPISVVVPVHNGEHYIAAALDSIRAQSRPPSEVIVVDDASTDASAQIAADFGARVVRHHSAATGPARARNTGVQLARAAWIAFLDADDLWEPPHLEIQMALAKETGADLVFSDARVFSPAQNWDSWLERSGHAWMLQTSEPVLDRPYALMIRRGFFALPSSVLVRAAAVRAAGGFDESMRPGPEDLDLWLRLAPSTRWAFNRRSKIARREAGGNLSANRFVMAEGAEQLWRKHRPTPLAELDADERWLVREHLAVAQWEQAYWGFRSGRMRLARRAALRSLRTHWSWRPAVYALAACLPSHLLAAIRRIRFAAAQISGRFHRCGERN